MNTLSKRFNRHFDDMPLPAGMGEMLFITGSEKKLVTIKACDVSTIKREDDGRVILSHGESDLTFKKSSYGFDDCYPVISDMNRRALCGDIADHKDYNKDGTRIDGTPLIIDVVKQSRAQKYKKARKIQT